MKSKANIKGHPIHPMLVAFPIAFFTGTLLADIINLVADMPGLGKTAYYLEIAGVITGLAAAIPGALDYFFTVPPDSSARERATMHALINITMVALFAIAWLLRTKHTLDPVWIIGMEGVGVILLCIAGWMGGTLVFRNQIGVDPRYANAGKWSEETIEANGDRIVVAKVNELKPNQMKLIRTKGKRIVLARTEDSYVAFDDRCTHKGGSLAGGSMICHTVQCPWHGSQFDVDTGAVKAGPARAAIGIYKVSEEGGKVYLEL